jgi:hypothetical protein
MATVIVVVLALGAIPLFGAVVVRTVRSYRIHRDSRARREFVVAVLLFITVTSAVIAGVVGRTLPVESPLRLLASGLPWGSIFTAGVVLLQIRGGR